MAVQPVLKMGHPLLAQVAAPVADFNSGELTALIADMDDTMRALNGAGIAAPQIGVGLRVVIFEVTENPRYPHVSAVPYTVLINPVITALDAEEEEPRARRVRYQGFDLAGRPIDRSVEGFHARVVQHEVDHLDGILYPQRVRDLKDFGFEDSLGERMTPMPD
jgi:peptide deformylase